MLQTGEGRARKVGRWVEDAFMRQLGLDVSANPYDITFRSLETAARTLAKIGVGAIGGVFSGGAVTAAMGAWAAYDIYEIYNIIQDM